MRTSTSFCLIGIVLLALLLMAFGSTPAAAFPSVTTAQKSLRAWATGPIVSGDFNGDGLGDLAQLDTQNDRIYVYYQVPTKGLPYDPQRTFSISSPRKAVTTDLNLDGKDELVVMGDDIITVLDGGGTIMMTLPTPGIVDLAVDAAEGNKYPDLAFLNSTGVGIWLGPGGGSIIDGEPDSFLSAPGFVILSLVDLRGDGIEDVVVLGSNGLTVLRRDSLTPPFKTRSYSVFDADEYNMDSGDFNYDGREDVIVFLSNSTSKNGVVQVWTQSTSGNLSLNQTLSGEFTAIGAVSDLGGGSRFDLVALDYGARLQIFLQPRAGLFLSTPSSTLTASSAQDASMASGKFDDDPWDDIALYQRSSSSILIFLQEDLPPILTSPIPSTFHFNQNSVGSKLIDLRDFFSDDHGKLFFSVVYQEKPGLVQAEMDPDGYHLTFKAQSNWYGSARFSVAASDGQEGHRTVVSNNFTVIVNAIPEIISSSPQSIQAGSMVRFQVVAYDAYPAGDKISFTLLDAPEGMLIDPSTGLITWKPAKADHGDHRVIAVARDSYGGVSRPKSLVFSVVFRDDAIPPEAYTAAAAAGILSAGGLAIFLNENWRYTFLIPFLPLYTKLRRERVLDHFIRGQIYGYIMANPGEHYNAIKEALGLTNGSLAHHLRTLEREEFVKSKRFGLYRRFYPSYMQLPDENFFHMNDVQRMIVEIIKNSPGISQKEIADRLNVTPPTINYHINILHRNSLVSVVKRGRMTHCFVASTFQDGSRGVANRA